MKFLLSANTARDINKARRAIAETDSAKLDSWERRSRSQELDKTIATLRIEERAVPVRCDILAKWTALHDAENFEVEIDESNTLTVHASSLRGVATFVRLLAPVAADLQIGVLPMKAIERPAPPSIEYTSAPMVEFAKAWKLQPPAPLPELVPDFDTSTACLTAKTLRARKAEAKREGERVRAIEAADQKRAEYEAARALLTPANIARAVKQAQSLRKLRTWARRVSPVIEALPNPVSLCYDTAPAELEPVLLGVDIRFYAAKWQDYHAAQNRFENYKPRGYYGNAKERARREKTMNQARRYVIDELYRGAEKHAEQFGFFASHYGGRLNLSYGYDSSFARTISDARKTVRQYVELESLPAAA